MTNQIKKEVLKGLRPTIDKRDKELLEYAIDLTIEKCQKEQDKKVKELKKIFRIMEAKDKRAMNAGSLGQNRGKYEIEVIEELIKEIDKIFANQDTSEGEGKR